MRFFVGDWSLFFIELDSIDADALTLLIKTKTYHSWWAMPRLRRCWIHVNEERRRCKAISPAKTGRLAIRLSYNKASNLLKDMHANNTRGHHEDIIRTHTSVHNFTIKTVPLKLIREAICGNNLKNKNAAINQASQLSSHSPVERNKCYHPVECIAYQPS